MKKKDLLKLIKTKSEEVNIKDFSQSIIDNAKLLPQREEVIVEPKKRFTLRASMIYSLTLVTAVIAFFVIYQPAVPAITQIEDVNQVVVLSAVSAVSLVTTSDDLLSQDDNISLSLGYFQPDITIDLAQVDDEINDVSRYLEMMEKLLNSDDDFGYQLETSNINGYAYHLSFTTKDLLEQETSYILHFNRQENVEENLFIMQGNIEIGDYIYAISAQGDLDNPQNVQLHLEKDASNYIDMTYSFTENMNQYRIQVTENNILLQAVNLELKYENGQKSVYMNFIEGQSTGSYAFRIAQVNQVNQMRASYYIAGSEVESGEFEISVNQDGEDVTYDITVKPQGQMPYVIERKRGMSESGGAPHRGNSMTSL